MLIGIIILGGLLFLKLYFFPNDEKGKLWKSRITEFKSKNGDIENDSIIISKLISSNKSFKKHDTIIYTHPFDTILEKCLDRSGQTTNDMIECYYTTTNILDSLVHGKYLEIYNKLDVEDKQKFKLSEDNWVKYYKSESDFLMSAFYTWANKSKYGHGREHSITQAEWRYTIVRQHLIDLTDYNEEIYIIDDETM